MFSWHHGPSPPKRWSLHPRGKTSISVSEIICEGSGLSTEFFRLASYQWRPQMFHLDDLEFGRNVLRLPHWQNKWPCHECDAQKPILLLWDSLHILYSRGGCQPLGGIFASLPGFLWWDKRTTGQPKPNDQHHSAVSSSFIKREMWLQEWAICDSAWSQILPNHKNFACSEAKAAETKHILPCLLQFIQEERMPDCLCWDSGSPMQLVCFHLQQNMGRPAALLDSSTPTMIQINGPPFSETSLPTAGFSTSGPTIISEQSTLLGQISVLCHFLAHQWELYHRLLRRSGPSGLCPSLHGGHPTPQNVSTTIFIRMVVIGWW